MAEQMSGVVAEGTLKRARVGITPRKHVRREQSYYQFARENIMLEAVAHTRLGIFYLREKGGGDGRLCAVLRIHGISKTGLSTENLLYNSRRLAAVLDRLPASMSVHSWQDVAIDQPEPLPTDWHNPYLAECERERNEMFGKRLQWRTENYLCLEWRGEFAQGGDIGKVAALKSGVEVVEAKASGERRRAARAKFRFMSLFRSENRRIRIYGDKFVEAVASFNEAIDGFVSAITSEANGIGAYQEAGSLVPQVGAAPKVMMKAERLNATDGFRAMYGLGDPAPWRRAHAGFQGLADLGAQIGSEMVDFNWLLTVAKGEQHDIYDEDLRLLGEHGPYTVGGVPRQIYAVRLLPGRGLPYDLFDGLRKAGVPFTTRVRWSRLTKEASQSWVKNALNEKRWSGVDLSEMTMAEVEASRIQESINSGNYGIGLGSILIALNGVPHRDERGRVVSGTETLLNGIRAVDKWSKETGVILASLGRPENQKTAHYAMYPGSFYLDPLEQIPIRALTLGKILPFYTTSPAAPRNTSYPGYPILTLEDASGALVQRGLEVGAVGLGCICGSTGTGKSYVMGDIVRNFEKNQGLLGNGAPRQTQTDLFEFGDGTDAGSSFNSLVRLLGGKVIQFASKASTSDVNNPFDLAVELDDHGRPVGYTGDDVLMLTDLLVTMGGGERTDRGAGAVSMGAKRAFQDAVIRMGRIPDGQLTGGVRCLENLVRMIDDGEAKALLRDWVDPKGLGAYFPSAPDSTRARIVNYNFQLAMNPFLRSVLFASVMARLNRRAYSNPAIIKLLIGDEVGAGLARGENDKDEAVIESARSMLAKLFANIRRFNGRAFLAFQRPSQIVNMGNTLLGTIRENSSTLLLYEINDKDGAQQVFQLSDSAFHELKNLDPVKRQFALIQGGQMGIFRTLNPLLAHAGNTTDPTERRLRDAMIATGRWGRGAALDVLGVVRAFVPHLRDLGNIRDDQDKIAYVEDAIRTMYSGTSN